MREIRILYGVITGYDGKTVCCTSNAPDRLCPECRAEYIARDTFGRTSGHYVGPEMRERLRKLQASGAGA